MVCSVNPKHKQRQGFMTEASAGASFPSDLPHREPYVPTTSSNHGLTPTAVTVNSRFTPLGLAQLVFGGRPFLPGLFRTQR